MKHRQSRSNLDAPSPPLSMSITNHHNHFMALFRDHPGESVPQENFCTLWCKGRLTEADTLTIQLGATPSRLISAHLHHLPIFLWAGCPSCRPTNSVKALKVERHSDQYAIKDAITRDHSVQLIPPPSHTEIGTVSLPASSRCACVSER